MNFKEGAFYNGIPGYSIKVNKKFNDGQTLGDVMIYDHSKGGSNTTVILADSGEMYMAHNDSYLVLSCSGEIPMWPRAMPPFAVLTTSLCVNSSI